MTTTDDHYGRLEAAPDGNDWQLVFTRRFDHPREKVWRALTEPADVSAWFPADIVGDRAEGASLRFVFRHGEGPEIPGELRIFDPVDVLEFSWGEEVMRFELQAVDGGARTELRFVNTFVDIGKAARDAAGWHTCLDILLAHLDGTEPPQDGWREVHPGYVERFPTEAATIGPPGGHS
ncbi:MAG TPA: SRPBCC family protein [Acidimicrobiales bacterium]|nr:SRPBCC family protein [Acidimicrobiales bacterium]